MSSFYELFQRKIYSTARKKKYLEGKPKERFHNVVGKRRAVDCVVLYFCDEMECENMQVEKVRLFFRKRIQKCECVRECRNEKTNQD